MDHAFQLVITRVFEDGDQELLEDEDESEFPHLVVSRRPLVPVSLWCNLNR